MEKRETLELFAAGKSEWNRWASEVLEERDRLLRLPEGDPKRNAALGQWTRKASVDFSEHTFGNRIELKEYIFPGDVNFFGSVFIEDVHFSNNRVHGSLHFSKCVFGSRFTFDRNYCSGNVSLFESNFEDTADIIRSKIGSNLNLAGTFVGLTQIGENSVKGAVVLAGAKFLTPNSAFRRVDFRGYHFSSVDLENVCFLGCDLRGADFTGTKLDNCDFSGSKMDTETSFKQATVENSIIHRFTLECLKDYGGLSKGEVMKMNIIDDVATLRKNYSGFGRWVHILSMLTFTFPYAWFLVSRWGEAKFTEDADGQHIPLWDALLRFIFNGGVNWQEGYSFHFSFIAFIFALFYNVLRAVLLRKTLALEAHQEITRLPAWFSLADTAMDISLWKIDYRLTWYDIYTATRILFLLLIVATAYNTWHFLNMEVPIQ